MKKEIKVICSYILLFLFPVALLAQDMPSSVAISSLRITPDTRAAAMGETAIGTTHYSAAALYNQAAASFAEGQTGFITNYVPVLKGITSGVYTLNLSGYHKIDAKQTVVASLRFFSMGDVEDRDYSNNLNGIVTPNEFVFDAGYARKLDEKLSMAMALRYINTNTAGIINGSGSASALAADVSLSYNAVDVDGQGFTAGAIVSNIGSRLNMGNGNYKDYLPARIGAGVSYTWAFTGNNTLMLASDFNKSLVPLIPAGTGGLDTYYGYGLLQSYGKGLGNNAMSVSAGAEYGYNGMLFLRTGYYQESEAYGDRKYFSAGLGVLYKSIGFDFAYVTPSKGVTAGNAGTGTLRFGLSVSIKNKSLYFMPTN